MQKVFIAYRTDDERHAAYRIRGGLEASSAIECRDLTDAGADFEQTVKESDVLLVVVGPQWAVASASATPEDPVARLVAAAAAADVTVRVALLDNSEAPDTDELPEAFAALAQAPVHDLTQERWSEDIAALVDALDTRPPQPVGSPQATTRQLLIAAGMVAVLAVLGGILVASRMWFDTPTFVGRWVAEVDYGRSVVREERFEFRVTGGDVTGSATYFGTRRVIENAVQDGERLTFHTRSHENRGSERRELRQEYVGIVSGDAIRFSLRSSGGFEERPPVEFEARRE